MAPSRGYGYVRSTETIQELTNGTRILQRGASSSSGSEKKKGARPPWKQSVYIAARLWLAGFAEACCFHRVVVFLVRSRVILRRTLQCFLLNGVFLGSIFFLEDVLVPVVQWLAGRDPIFSNLQPGSLKSSQGASEAGFKQGSAGGSPLEAILVTLYSIMWLYPAYVTSFVINCLWYNEIAKHAFRTLAEERAQASASQAASSNPSSSAWPSPASSTSYPTRDLARTGGSLAFAVAQNVIKAVLSFPALLKALIHWLRTWRGRSASRNYRGKSMKGEDKSSLAASASSPAFGQPYANSRDQLPASDRSTPGDALSQEASQFRNRSTSVDTASESQPPAHQLPPHLRSTGTAGAGMPPPGQAGSSRGGTSKEGKFPLNPLLRGIGEQVFSLVMLTSFSLQVMLVSQVPYVGRPMSFLCLSWLYAYYCFDYQWGFASWSLEKRLHFFESNWAFFAGFGTPCVLATLFQSTLVSAGVGAVLFPLFILVATASDPAKAALAATGGDPNSHLGRFPIFRLASSQASFLIRAISGGLA